MIGNRRIEKETRGGIIMWRECELVPATVEERFDRSTGEKRTIQHPATTKELRRCIDAPHAVIEALQQEHNAWRVFDPREPNELWDWLEQKIAAGDRVGVEIYIASNKVKPRVPLTGLPLGSCFKSRGTLVPSLAAWLTDDALRTLLKRHANGDWGMHGHLADVELDDDRRWCPPLFGVATVNAVAVESGRGLVRSIYPETFEKTRGVEEIRIVTWIGQATYIYIRSRDSISI
jgi:hypothetical protein